MQKTLSKEHIADIAHSAVSSLRKLVSHDSLTTPQQDLVITSKCIEERWVKKRSVVSTSVLELWATSFDDEIRFQQSLHGGGSGSTKGSVALSGVGSADPLRVMQKVDQLIICDGPRKPISEASLLLCFDALRILCRTLPDRAVDALVNLRLAQSMIIYFVVVPLSKKVRDTLAGVLVDLLSEHPVLLSESISTCCELLFSRTDAAVAAPSSSSPDTTVAHGSCEGRIGPQQMHLALLLFNALRQADAIGAVGVEELRVRCGLVGLVTSLVSSAVELLATCDEEVKEAQADGPVLPRAESNAVTTGILHLCLLGGLVRGCQMNKSLVLKQRDMFLRCWTVATSCVVRVEASFSVPTGVPGKDAVVLLDGLQTWISELTEVLVEVCTDDSFCLRRQALFNDLTMDELPVAHSPSASGTHVRTASATDAAHSPANATQAAFSRASSNYGKTPPGSPAALFMNARRYEILPSNWDSLLTSGSPIIWRLASLVSNCLLVPDTVNVIIRAIVSVDVSNPVEDTIYRLVISALLLLSTANPRNAETLAAGGMFPAILALLTSPTGSAFPRSVKLGVVEATPAHQVAGSSSILTMSLYHLVGASFLTAETLRTIMNALDTMRSSEVLQQCENDAEIIGSVLHSLLSAVFPCNTLFFTGMSNVVCKVDKFVGRWYGYSLCMWVHPLCVWVEGSLLFSFTDPSSDSIVMLSIVANGRSASLALRIQSAKELTISVIPDTTLPSDRWSHLVVMHNISGFVVYINGRKTANSISVPFPKEPSKRNRLEISFGGSSKLPSFVGSMACLELLDASLSEKDIERLYAAGPQSTTAVEPPVSNNPLLLVRRVEAADGTMNIDISGMLVGKHEGVSVSRVVPYRVIDVAQTFEEFNVDDWALAGLAATPASPNFVTVARLYTEFLCFRFSMATSTKALDALSEKQLIERLQSIVFGWDEVPAFIPSALIAFATPQESCKIVRAHQTTDAIFSLLTDLLVQRASECQTVSAVLRALSDCLASSENAAIFRKVGDRFSRILCLSSSIPQECIECLVILVEKLCKEQREMEEVLLFLLFAPATRTLEIIKCELLRMLYDIARPDVTMCDLIGGAFDGRGISFLVMLINGMNHNSEAIRVYALRLLALMLHTNSKFRDAFIKVHGFEVLGLAMSTPKVGGASLPAKLVTFNCLFQVALDYFQPTQSDSAMMSRLQGQAAASTSRGHGRRHSHSSGSKYQDPTRGSVGPSLGLQGHLPSLVKRKFRAAQREVSFDVSALECINIEGRLLADETYNSTGVQNVLKTPQAIHLIFILLETLLTSTSPLRAPSVASLAGAQQEDGSLLVAGTATAGSDIDGTSGEASGTDYVQSPLARRDDKEAANAAGSKLFSDSRQMGGTPEAATATNSCLSYEERINQNIGDSLSTNSVASPREDDSTETIVLKVLAYLEKIVDVPGNAEALAPFGWLEWLWSAVRPVLGVGLGTSLMGSPSVLSASTSNPHHFDLPLSSHRFMKKFVSSVLARTRNIIRKVTLIDLSRNSKAATVRRIRSMYYEPQLVRIVVEQVVSHFSKSTHCEMADTTEAMNIIRNLDALYSCVEDIIDPLPLALGVDIGCSISAIAVNNNTWVRRRMKDSSKLFDIRDRMAFTLLCSIPRFTACELALLQQLVEANSHNLKTMAFFLRRLVFAVQAHNVEETELLLTLIRQLIRSDDDQRKVLYRVLSAEYSELGDIILGSVGSLMTPTQCSGGSSGGAGLCGATSTDQGAAMCSSSSDSCLGLRSEERIVPAVTAADVSTIISWSSRDEQHWEGAVHRITRAAKAVDSETRSIDGKREKEKAAMQKALRAYRERHKLLDSTVLNEFHRIHSEVEAIAKESKFLFSLVK